MRIAVNAIPIRPGGGLTVLLGLLDGLRKTRPADHITVVCRAQDTMTTVHEAGCVDEILNPMQEMSTARAFVWQNYGLGRLLSGRRTDVLLTFNHYLSRVTCPQVIYHLNLRRFSRQYRDRRPGVIVQEALRDWAARRAIRHGDANIFESEYLQRAAHLATGQTPRHAEVIYIGLSSDLVTMAADSQSLYRDGGGQLISITSPNPHKDNSTLIRTIAQLVDRQPQVDWRLDIAGGIESDAWAPYRDLARQLGVSDRITWHGFCDNNQLDVMLRRALCLIATSVMESFAMVPLEAMARGCPTVVADTSSMPESVGAAGILAPPHSPAGFATAIMRLHQQPHLRQRHIQWGLARARRFRWSECADRFCRVFDRIHGRAA